MKELKADLGVLKEKTKNIFDISVINTLAQLRHKYIRAMRKVGTPEEKLERLNKILMLSMAYIERLTAIRNDIKLISSEAKTLHTKAKRKILMGMDSTKVKKKDIDTLMLIKIGAFKDFVDTTDAKLEIVDTSLETLNKTQFALKSVIANYRDSVKPHF